MSKDKRKTDANDGDVERTIRLFSQIYLGGIPPIITNDSAYLSFVSVLVAIEALAGYRYKYKSAGKRFKSFVRTYFPDAYMEHVDDLWNFRNKIVHAFSPKHFALMHHHSEVHLGKTEKGIALNAEDFYGALLSAAQKYFAEVRSKSNLKKALIRRLRSPEGGSIMVGPTKTDT
ncbi:MAG: hypothetical protein ACW992_09885 [Candidatus Thorarchaeota archaeon]|jgi:hypothetical protein